MYYIPSIHIYNILRNSDVTEYNITNIHNSFPFFRPFSFRSTRKRLREPLAGTCRSRKKSEIAMPARSAPRTSIGELVRCLDILRDLTARSSFMRLLFLSYTRLFPMWAMRVRELHIPSTSYQYVRPKNYTLRFA